MKRKDAQKYNPIIDSDPQETLSNVRCAISAIQKPFLAVEAKFCQVETTGMYNLLEAIWGAIRYEEEHYGSEGEQS